MDPDLTLEKVKSIVRHREAVHERQATLQETEETSFLDLIGRKPTPPETKGSKQARKWELHHHGTTSSQEVYIIRTLQSNLLGLTTKRIPCQCFPRLYHSLKIFRALPRVGHYVGRM